MSLSANGIDAHVGLRIRRRRESLGISQARLGGRLGLTFSQIQKYEKGTNRIGAGRLYQIAGYLGVPASYFFEGLDDSSEVAGSAATGRLGRDEILAVTEAFAAIEDHEARSALLALLRSLASVHAPRVHRAT